MTTVRRQYSPEPWESALQAWLQRALRKEVAAIPVIYANQAGPRPGWPFATLQVISVTDVGTGERSLVDDPVTGDPYEFRVDQIKRGTVSVRAFGHQARGLTHQADLDWKLPESVEANRQAGLSIIAAVSGPLDIPSFEDGQPYLGSQLDLAFLFHLRLSERIGAVAKIEATGSVDGVALEVDYP